MALNLKNAAVDQLVADVARLAGESKTEVIRRALEERKRRLMGRSKSSDANAYSIPPPARLARAAQARARAFTDADDEDQILGYGPEGV